MDQNCCTPSYGLDIIYHLYENTGKTCRERKIRDFYLGKVMDFNNTGNIKGKLSVKCGKRLILWGSAVMDIIDCYLGKKT